MTRPHWWLIGIAAIALASGVLLLQGTAVGPSGPRQSSLEDPGTDSRLEEVASLVFEEIERIRTSAAGDRPVEIRATAGGIPSLVEHESSTDGEHWGRLPRSDADLARILLSGSYRAQDFVRHVHLNPTDRPIGSQDYKDLVGIVDRLVQARVPLQQAMLKEATADRIEMLRLDPAAVDPVESTPGDRARSITKTMELLKAQGRIASEAEAARLLRQGEAFHAVLPPNSSLIGGKVYRNESFPAGPRFANGFALVRHAAIQEATIIFGWFVFHDFCAFGEDLVAVMIRMQEMPMRDVVMSRTAR